ncbi:hypothetical protein EOD23_34960 [Mesorhizobium sp. USDA-HM6]|nr:hypothetical protein EOD23_34960 [Mesorhizobium sp. USDA-HM6]
MRCLNRRLDSLRLLGIDQFLFQDRLIEIHVDIGHCLIELDLIELAVEISVGDRLVGSGVSLDRLNVSGLGLLDLAVIERQFVLERHLDGIVEIGIECRLGRRLDSGGLDSGRPGGRDGAMARLMMVDPEALIQRGCHFLVDGKVVL